MDNGSAGRGRVLLAIARASISTALGDVRKADEGPSWLLEQGACFVTLTQQQCLRGCLGTLEAHRPLLQDVKENARAAALRDPRFEPLTIGELDYTSIEVSLLTPKERVRFTSELDACAQLRPGIDGVLIEYGHYRGTFLPQVWDQLPSRVEFMTHLKQKAGLPVDFWAPDLSLYRYHVQKWSEADPLNKMKGTP